MKNWFTSLNGALVISFCAVLAFLWSALLDMSLVWATFNLSMWQIGFGALILVGIVGLWLWGLAATLRGSRRGLVTAIIFAILLALYALMDWIAYCPTTCPRLPVYYLANALNLGLGLAASVALVIQIRKPMRADV